MLVNLSEEDWDRVVQVHRAAAPNADVQGDVAASAPVATRSFWTGFRPRGIAPGRRRSQVVSATCPDGGVGYGTCREAAAAVVGGA